MERPSSTLQVVASVIIILMLMVCVVAFLLTESLRNNLGDRLPPTDSHTSVAPATRTPMYRPTAILEESVNLVGNPDFKQEDFGVIGSYWNSDLTPYRWYLIQDIPPDSPNTRWVDWINLADEKHNGILVSTVIDAYGAQAVQWVPAEEGFTYILSTEARIIEGNYASISLEFIDAYGGLQCQAMTQEGFGSEWSRQSLTAVSVAGTQYVRITLWTGFSPGDPATVVYWDNVDLHLGESAP